MAARFDGGRSVTDRLDRRRFLAGTAGALVALAGCTQSDNDGGGTDPSTEADQATPTGGTRSNGETAAPGATTDGSTTAHGKGTPSNGGTTVNETTEGDGDLDLREANVVDVAFDRGDGTVKFDVTLYHDDDGEAEYANWWQVETLDGERLGRRELLHAHSTAPFTRSETIDVPDDVTCVVVRGHDQIHEYGGQAALVNLESGETNLVRQGTEKQSFDASDCP